MEWRRFGLRHALDRRLLQSIWFLIFDLGIYECFFSFFFRKNYMNFMVKNLGHILSLLFINIYFLIIFIIIIFLLYYILHRLRHIFFESKDNLIHS